VWFFQILPEFLSGFLIHLIAVFQVKLLNSSPIVCEVGLAMEFAIRELARVIFFFSHFAYHRK
jgi:hypothetical protein